MLLREYATECRFVVPPLNAAKNELIVGGIFDGYFHVVQVHCWKISGGTSLTLVQDIPRYLA